MQILERIPLFKRIENKRTNAMNAMYKKTNASVGSRWFGNKNHIFDPRDAKNTKDRFDFESIGLLSRKHARSSVLIRVFITFR